eukprot:TRINITY_DN5460_c0_g1_i1.p1 TRINITY_DN5460_c0_g1~~TRINITY_DN5460_c0_g1_i1.p1  ORF type:complete len:609 (-),score=165.31 TRINITY_DN5460_c0_g1_i1:53-1780(-)
MKQQASLWMGVIGVVVTMLALLAMWSPTGVEGVHTFEVYPLFNMERNSVRYGSNSVSVNALATLDTKAIGTTPRKVIVVDWEQFDPTLLSGLNSSHVSGYLIIVPDLSSTFESSSSSESHKTAKGDLVTNEQIESWRAKEAALLQLTFDFPIYFAPRTSVVQQLYQELKSASSSLLSSGSSSSSPFGDTYQLVVSGDISPLESPSVTTIHGWLSVASGYEDEQASENRNRHTATTIAIVANYDSFAIAPGMSRGTDSNGSGLVALLELARVFSRLYNSYKTQAGYNILFVITGGGRLNYAGSKNWLNTLDPRVLENLEFVLCLDTIGGVSSSSPDSLYLHMSRSLKDEKISRFYQDLSEAAKKEKISIDAVQKKINVSNPDVFWEHEQYSKKRVASATLSSLSTPTLPLFERSNIFDSTLRIDGERYKANVKIVAEAVAKYVYDLHEKDLNIFEGANDISASFLSSWLNAVSSLPRTESHVASKDTDGNSLLLALQKVLEEYTTDVTVQKFLPENEFKLETSTRLSLTMSAYKMKPVLFDLLLTFVIMGYLAAVYVSLKGVPATVAAVKSIIHPK